jgi:hypothetical protein
VLLREKKLIPRENEERERNGEEQTAFFHEDS